MRIKNDYLKYLRYTKSTFWSNYLLEKGVPVSDFYYLKKGNTVHIRSIDHSFSPGDYPVFFDGYNKYCWKFIENGFRFVFTENDLFIEIGDLKIKIDTVQELYIINEVFLENTYKIESSSDYVVFDIGMNVGITSLYLSSLKNIKDIYGFEPFKPTFDCATANVGYNTRHMSKIHLNNFGLSNVNSFINLGYDPKNKGNLGVKTVGVVENDGKNVEQIELRKASECLRPLVDKHSTDRFIIKLDCEGSEYDIIENLDQELMLEKFDVFMIEWHKMEGYKTRLDTLISLLKKSGFVVFATGSFDHEIGMIYALNNHSLQREQ
ncbi:FkbM family methyltransferase [Segetibacter aerophilus]|uniref:Methyltransferase FkbM domain-containing protein n=1 Tax=Segetibacter aerophilus TaxID=670293 RepID=A0A512B6L4_9BACT|nr:FkbM family methyltransferase [Segetibacter aerophilus]GEO07605.1 hypothetical protein SAE01_01010 [Segetibacter aerophilus]